MDESTENEMAAGIPSRNAAGLTLATLPVGPLHVNCYLLAANPDPPMANRPTPCAAIDPGDDARRIAKDIDQRGWTLRAFLLTHAHADHIGAVPDLREAYPEAVVMASAETSRRMRDPRLNLSGMLGQPFWVGEVDKILISGETFEAAGILFLPTEIPGHDPGELVYGVREMNWLFTGDVVFQGGIGRADFPGGDMEALVAASRALLAAWPPDAIVYPGHGPRTTAGRELAENPFLAI